MNTAVVYALIAAGANLIGGLVITSASPRGRQTKRLLIGFGELPTVLDQRCEDAAIHRLTMLAQGVGVPPSGKPEGGIVRHGLCEVLRRQA